MLHLECPFNFLREGFAPKSQSIPPLCDGQMKKAEMPVTSEEEEDDASPSDDLAQDGDDASGSDIFSEQDEEDDDDDDDDDEKGSSAKARPPPLLPSHNFAPPFYGRPSTPLPPSPSLTSLLRPSRPTTPDASDDENVEPVPRASPKVPTYEYYGFVLYLFSSFTFVVWLLWSFLPSPFLHGLGIYYYPNRWWSLAIPSFLVVLVCYVYVALAAYNTEILTLPVHGIETVVDDAAQVAVVDARGRIRDGGGRRRRRGGAEGGAGARKDRFGTRERERERERDGRETRLASAQGLNWREIWSHGTDAVMDVPLAGVCEVLYGEGRAREEDGNGLGVAAR
jgi:phosphatidylinositol glycan class P protein